MSASAIRTAVLPVAGLGTRLLPATKATPKELLPVYDTPLLEFAIREVASIPGIERLVVVAHPSKSALRRYFETDDELLEKLRREKKDQLAEVLANTGTVSGAETVFVHQHRQAGLGHAVLCAAGAVLDGPLAVILPDDLILPETCIADMARVYDPKRAGMMIAAMKVTPDEIGNYGSFAVTSGDGALIAATGIVEKPSAAAAPSLFAAVGRYILPAEIFEALEGTAPGHQGEIQLTDAIDALVGSHGLEGYRFSGHRFDCGNHEGLLAASNWRRRHLSLSQSIAFDVSSTGERKDSPLGANN